MKVNQFSDDNGTEFDAGDLGTLAIALIQHAKDMQ